MSRLITGAKESPDFNLVYRFVEAIAAAEDPGYVAHALFAYYGGGLDPHVAIDIDVARHAEDAFREWRPGGRGLRMWRPAEVVEALIHRAGQGHIQGPRRREVPPQAGGAR